MNGSEDSHSHGNKVVNDGSLIKMASDEEGYYVFWQF